MSPRNLVVASTKTYTHSQGLSCCFRQWRAKSHCRFLHGYALQITLEFRTKETDENGWVVDFGSLKPVKAWLEFMFDHRLLIAEDDPMKDQLLSLDDTLAQVIVVKRVGCEGFAEMIYDYVEGWLGIHYGERVKLYSVEVREHAGNSARVFNNTLVTNP